MLDVVPQHALQGYSPCLFGTGLYFFLFELGQMFLMEAAYPF